MSSDFRFQDIFVRGVQDPYPFYHWLRTEAPVYWNAEVVPAWFISRYDDVVAITEDDRRFGSREGIESAVQQEQDGCFWHTQAAGALFTDGTAHSRARGLLDQSWSSQQIAQMRGRILELANTLLDRVRAAGTMDVVTDFAEPLSYTVFREFVGATDLDLVTLNRWATTIHATYDPLGGPDEAARGQQVCREVSTYFRDLIGRHRKSPTTDFVSSMLAAEHGGTQFTDEEILGNLIQIIPGPDALMMLISNAVLALLRHSDQLALLKKDPALIGGAVEECLRYDSLILGFPRVATEDVNVPRPVNPQWSAGVSSFAVRQPRPGPIPGPRPSGHYATGPRAVILWPRRPLLPRRASGSTAGADRHQYAGATIDRAPTRRGYVGISQAFQLPRPAGAADQFSGCVVIVLGSPTKNQDYENIHHPSGRI